jgi:hypothetical protein
MTRHARSPRVGLVLVGVVVAVAALVVGLGRAASVPTTFTLTLAPKPVVTVGERSLATLFFDYAGPTPTKLNHTSVNIDLPSGSQFLAAFSSSGCTPSQLPTGQTRVSCAVGTVLATDAPLKRFVFFTAPTTPQDGMVVRGFAAYGEGVKDSGGASHQDVNEDTDVWDVRATGHQNGLGKCTTGGGTLSTPLPTTTDPQSTAATYGATTGPEGQTCVSVGEQFVAGLVCGSKSCTSQVSFVSLPALDGVVTAVVTALNLPRGETWETVSFFELKNFPDDQTVTNAIRPCSVVGTLTPAEDVCLDQRAKFKSGGQFTFKMLGLGKDPGVVF